MSDHGRHASPEDLSARSRRGLLSSAEERELERELETNSTLRASHAVGVDLDRATAVRAGDEGLVARAADAALARIAASGLSPSRTEQRVSGFAPRPSPSRRRGLALLLAAALVSVTGIAAAFWTGFVNMPGLRATSPRETPRDGRSATERKPAASPATESRAAVAASSAPERAPSSIPAQTAPDADDTANALPRPRSQRAPEATAASLFRTANGARRDGDFARAKRTYSDLIARFPASDEARLAQVSLGKLLLAKGDPKDAEREFDRYLKGGSGQLAEEALASRAESFQKLGRMEEERVTWQRLLAEHPDSVYAGEARGRLDALRRGGKPPLP